MQLSCGRGYKRRTEKYRLVQIIHTIVCGSPRQGLAQQTVSEAAEASYRQNMSHTCSSMHTMKQVEDPSSQSCWRWRQRCVVVVVVERDGWGQRQ